MCWETGGGAAVGGRGGLPLALQQTTSQHPNDSVIKSITAAFMVFM